MEAINKARSKLAESGYQFSWDSAVTRVKDHHTDSSTLMKKGRAKGKPLENAMRESFDEVQKVTPIEDCKSVVGQIFYRRYLSNLIEALAHCILQGFSLRTTLFH